ncbi:hypothetical protein [Streptomyces celluloflavus]
MAPGRVGGDPLQLGDDHGHRLVVVDGRELLAPVTGAREVGAGGLLQALDPALMLCSGLPGEDERHGEAIRPE